MDKIKIEYQYFEGCPNSKKLMENLQEAISDFKDKVSINYILIEDNETALKIGFRGSPTLLINGEDFEGLESPAEPGLNCRIYKNGIPSASDIKNKLITILQKK